MDRQFTDAQMQHHVRAQLDWEPGLDDAHIDIEVHDGIAALTGQVNSCLARWTAERAAKRVSGVRGVTSAIGVASSRSIRLSDADIARSAQSMLQWITLLPVGSVQPAVDGGWITLSGSVRWDYQKEAAAAAVRCAIGAAGVTDHITLVADGPPPAKRSLDTRKPASEETM
jgi:osmotically-inducible protein OsmY